MNILKRLFGRAEPTLAKNPTARERFTIYRERFASRKPTDPERLALDILEPTTRFAMRGTSPLPQLAQYTSDACLFELACYTIATCDYWLFARSSPLRIEIGTALSNFAQEVFVFAFRFSHEGVAQLMNERISEYGQMFARRINPQGLHLRLSQVLLSSSAMPTPALGAMSEVTFGDPIAGLSLTRALIDWDQQHLESSITILKRASGTTT